MTAITMNDALERAGAGAYQRRLMGIFGLVWAADAMQVLAVGFTATVLVAPATAAQASPPAEDDAKGGGKVLTVAVSQSVDSLSPFLAQKLLTTSIHRLAYEYLTNYDAKDAKPIPGAAERCLM